MRKILLAVLLTFVAIQLYGCGTTSETQANPVVPIRGDADTSHKISIINASQTIVNTVKYKPCGSDSSNYQYLTGNLRPTEKLTINIYSQCIDLLATNAFKKKLVDAQNINLTTTKIWTIK